MTNEELNAKFALLVDAQRKTDEQLAKTDAQLAKTDALVADMALSVKSIGKQLGGMAANQGDVAEEFFSNGLADVPVIGGVRFDRVQSNVVVGKPGRRKEFDIVLVNGSSVALIEVKYKVHLKDVAQALEQVSRYRELYPEHESFTIYSGVAGMSVPQEVIDAAHEAGLFVLQCKADVMDVDVGQMRGF